MGTRGLELDATPQVRCVERQVIHWESSMVEPVGDF
jgi:hypothetical protein